MTFDAYYCLNMPHRVDRWKQACYEFDLMNIDVHQVQGISHKDPKISFCLGMMQMIHDALKNDGETFLLMEDDVTFVRPELLPYCMAELPDNWDIFYLGANLQNVHTLPERYSFHLWRVYNAWTTHAVAYTRQALELIAERYEKELQNVINDRGFDTQYMYDCWLGREILPAVNAYVAIPNIAHQRPGFSDIWGHEVNYTNLFN